MIAWLLGGAAGWLVAGVSVGFLVGRLAHVGTLLLLPLDRSDDLAVSA